MNQYLPQQHYYYYPQQQYQPQFWQAIIGAMTSIIVIIALGSVIISMTKKVWKGEEVEAPLLVR